MAKRSRGTRKARGELLTDDDVNIIVQLLNAAQFNGTAAQKAQSYARVAQIVSKLAPDEQGAGDDGGQPE
ncbi:MAG: hypothetical protein ACE5FI_16410 [Anaerolineales bacterium]